MPKNLMRSGKSKSGDLFSSPDFQRLSEHERLLEAEFQAQLIELFTAAKWTIVRESGAGRMFPGDIMVSHTELGRDRRYVIACVKELNPITVRRGYEDFRRYMRSFKQPLSDFDEFWLVGQKFASEPMRKRPKNDRHFRTLDIKQLKELLAVPKPKKSKAITKVGKAILANEKEIGLAIDGLVLQIDAKLEVLNAARPNSDEARANVAQEISDFERMKAELDRIREMVAAFKKGKTPEQEVVKVTKTFRQGVEQWWTNHSDDILSSTAKGAVLVSLIGLLALMKADSVAAIGAAAAVVSGGTLEKAKKIGRAIKRIGKRILAGDDDAVQ